MHHNEADEGIDFIFGKKSRPAPKSQPAKPHWTEPDKASTDAMRAAYEREHPQESAKATKADPEPDWVRSIPIYYDLNGIAWTCAKGDLWGKTIERQVTRELYKCGFRKAEEGNNSITIEQAHDALYDWHRVEYVGPLAGRITSSPTIIAADPRAACPLIDRIMLGMFGEVQLPYILGYLKVAREDLDAGQTRPGQILTLAGPIGTGKSVFQKYIVTPILGGRAANPYRYMIGRTEFNKDLFGAEHHMMSDQSARDDMAERRRIAAYLKAEASDDMLEGQHAKTRDATLMIPHFRRVSISCNDRREDLLILPPMDEYLLPKFMLFCVGDDAADEFPDTTPTNRQLFQRTITTQLPAFIAKLYAHRIPRELADKRYGIKAYAHPELLRRIHELDPAVEALTLARDAIDRVIAKTIPQGEPEVSYATRFTATRIFQCIHDFAFLRDGLRAVATSPDALGRLLSQLADKHGSRGVVDLPKLNGRKTYQIVQLKD